MKDVYVGAKCACGAEVVELVHDEKALPVARLSAKHAAERHRARCGRAIEFYETKTPPAG